MKKVLTILLILIVSVLSFGIVGCDNAEKEPKVEPYILASLYPVEGYNAVTGMMRQVGVIGQKPYIRVEHPNLEGWYVTYSSDNETMLTIDDEGRCDVWRAGTVYITVTYTNGVDKVTDMLSMYNTHWNRDIDVFFRAPGLDTGDRLTSFWSMTVGNDIELNPLLVFSSGQFDDCILESVTSSDEEILAFEDGKLVAKQPGVVEIVVDCSWRGYTYKSWSGGGGSGTGNTDSGSADLRRTITVTVNG